MMKHCYGIDPPRATRDVDLGVRVADWEKYNRLTDALIATGKFAATRKRQRFCFDTVLIDIVPFGAIANERKRISWPPEHEILMSLFAFEESYEYAVTVRLSSDPEFDIRLPTLPGLALMKIISSPLQSSACIVNRLAGKEMDEEIAAGEAEYPLPQ